MKPKTVKFPLVTRRDGDGNITHEYIEIPVSVYIEWIKKCYDLSGDY